MELFVLASREVVVALALAGLSGRHIRDREALLSVLEDSETLDRVRILIVEEEVAQMAPETIDRMKLDPSAPLIVEIPGVAGAAEDRRTPLDLVRQALGINI